MIYLASPNTQQQAEHAAGMPVLLSFACWSDWHRRYQQTYRRIMIDSGAYTEFTTGKAVDLGAYVAWAEQWVDHADAIAGLDSIKGDWRQSMRNYEAFPKGFPTFHETDPEELLDELIPMARERGGWLGFGMLPATRAKRGKQQWVRETVRRIPDDIHLHGWAMRGYAGIRRFDSFDSTNWWRDALLLKGDRRLNHLSYGECLEIITKRYLRESRMIEKEEADSGQTSFLEMFHDAI